MNYAIALYLGQDQDHPYLTVYNSDDGAQNRDEFLLAVHRLTHLRNRVGLDPAAHPAPITHMELYTAPPDVDGWDVWDWEATIVDQLHDWLISQTSMGEHEMVDMYVIDSLGHGTTPAATPEEVLEDFYVYLDGIVGDLYPV